VVVAMVTWVVLVVSMVQLTLEVVVVEMDQEAQVQTVVVELLLLGTNFSS
jgi:hypothetical protein